MSSSAAASSYWRVAGMSYLKYSNLCADMVRASLKEPQRTQAKLREAVYYRAAVWKDGKPEKQGAFFASGRCGCMRCGETGVHGCLHAFRSLPLLGSCHELKLDPGSERDSDASAPCAVIVDMTDTAAEQSVKT